MKVLFFKKIIKKKNIYLGAMNNFLTNNLISPIDRSNLIQNGLFFSDKGTNRFPIINGVPVLINDEQSVFKISNFKDDGKSIYKLKKSFKSFIINFLVKTKPSITLNKKSKITYLKLLNDIKKKGEPKVLIVGAGEGDGSGFDSKAIQKIGEVIKTDVVLSSYVDVICDAHQLPFKKNIFDVVIIQAVLEHVADPNLCVNEIHRVLKKGGLIYAETPFMQQVHLGRYDFTRFTHIGHKRLFNNFKELDSGPVCGPATVLAWSIKYFVRCFFKPSFAQFFTEWITTFFYFWIKYFDYILINKPGAYDASSGYFFYGEKADKKIPDDEIIEFYKGMINL